MMENAFRWSYCVIVPGFNRTLGNHALDAAKREFLKTKVLPVILPRRWFFRRQAVVEKKIDKSTAIESFAVYVELKPGETIETLRQALDLYLNATGERDIYLARVWDPDFRPGYGGEKYIDAMPEFVTKSAHRTISEGKDPIEIAHHYINRYPDIERGIAHWYAHLREGKILSDNEALRLIKGSASK